MITLASSRVDHADAHRRVVDTLDAIAHREGRDLSTHERATATALIESAQSAERQALIVRDIEARMAASITLDDPLGSAVLMLARYARNGRGTSERVEISAPVETRALITSKAGGGGAVTDATRLPAPAVSTLWNLFTPEPVTAPGGLCGYLSWPSAIAEAADVAEGAAKPQAQQDSVYVVADLGTVAHWTQVPRSALEDHTAMRGLIDGRLSSGIARKRDRNAAAALAAASLPSVSADSALAALRAAIADVQTRDYVVTGVAANPLDLATITLADLAALAVTVVPSAAITAGTIIAGDFASAGVAFARPIEIYVSTSHGSTFTSNVVTVLGEQRVHAAVREPDALSVATVTTTP